jgi:hypothetical protein
MTCRPRSHVNSEFVSRLIERWCRVSIAILELPLEGRIIRLVTGPRDRD